MRFIADQVAAEYRRSGRARQGKEARHRKRRDIFDSTPLGVDMTPSLFSFLPPPVELPSVVGPRIIDIYVYSLLGSNVK